MQLKHYVATIIGISSAVLMGGSAATIHRAYAQSQSDYFAQIPVNARVIYVNPALGEDTPNNGRENTPYRTISYALTRATDNTVLQLAPGSYTADSGEAFPLTIPPDVILRGDESTNGQTVLILGGGALISPTFARQNVTILALDDSQIRGVTVTNPLSRGTGIWIESSDAVVRNSTLSNSLRDGIFVTGTATPTIEDNVFFQNDGNGVAVVRSSQGTIQDNEFRNTGFGIAVGDDAAPVIEENVIRENVDGVVISNRAQPILRRNVIQQNVRDGVVAIADAQPNLGINNDDPGENIIRDNGRHDVYNATRSNILTAVGNDIDPDKISGDVEFVAREIPQSGFVDVRGHWAEGYITALAELDVIGGFLDGTYRPNDPVTRAQFAAIVNKAFSPDPKRQSIEFVDVDQTFWGYSAIQTAYQGQFLSGYPGQVFRPDERIPRTQVLVSLSSGLELTNGQLAALDKYADAGQIPEWAKDAIAAATQQRIVVNYPDVSRLNPSQNATRADVAAFVYQALVSTGDAEPILSPYLVTYP
ncbi:MAG: DUF1565 domain-containing protein [Cyanobacteria bacterium J06627_8]